MAKRVTPPKHQASGRNSVFRGKEGGDRIHGIITPIGSACFETVRDDLGVIVSRPSAQISDGDAVEYAVRVYVHGKGATEKLIKSS